MKKLILLLAAILFYCQSIVAQPNIKQPEFSTWVKVEYVTNIADKRDNGVVSVNFGQVAQTRQQAVVPWKITAVAVGATIMEAFGDAYYDKGKTEGNQNQMMTGKAFQAASLASHFLYIPIMRNSNTNWLWVPVVEICWRYTLFDPCYNMARGVPLGYIGNTSYYDRALQSFDPPLGMQLFGRGVVATFTISITFDKF